MPVGGRMGGKGGYAGGGYYSGEFNNHNENIFVAIWTPTLFPFKESL